MYDARGDRVMPGDIIWSYGLKGRGGHFRVTEVLPGRRVKAILLLAGNYLVGEAVELDAATTELAPESSNTWIRL